MRNFPGVCVTADRTIVYIDGLNLYHRLLRGRPNCRWLDPVRLARQVVPGVHIEKVKYFTARVRDFDASGAPRRQDIYLLALQTLGLVEIHFGTFRINAKKRKLVTPLPDGTQFVEVLMPEEKGSDVNLGCHLVLDGALDRYDTALVLTNDSDLAEPIRLTTSELHEQVVLLHPSDSPAGSLVKAGPSKVMRLQVNSILKSQLPDPVVDAVGRTISKPPTW